MQERETTLSHLPERKSPNGERKLNGEWQMEADGVQERQWRPGVVGELLNIAFV